MNDLNRELDSALQALRARKQPVDRVLALAAMLPRVIAETLDMACAEFHSEAGRLDSWEDREIGALILERVADTETSLERKPRLLREALFRARGFASRATAAGEGHWRMRDVDRIEAKMNESRTTSGTVRR